MSNVLDDFPSLKEKVNTYMLENVIGEFGNPDAPGFTFSKKYSDEHLLRVMDMIDKNKVMKEEYFGGAEGIVELESTMNEKNIKYKEASDRITNLREAILQTEREFDERAGYMPNPEVGGVISAATTPFVHLAKLITQGTLGWTDWFRDPGTEKIENRDFMWDPVNKRMGPKTEDLKNELRDAYDYRNNTLNSQYYEDTEKYKEYKDMVTSDLANRDLVNSTGIDEAMRYLDLESLRTMLAN